MATVRRRRVWKLSEQQNHRCCYCYRQTWVFDGVKSSDHRYYPDRLKGMTKYHQATADHYIPSSQGGGDGYSNLVMCCYRCNHLRGDMPALAFWEIMQDPAKIKTLIRTRNKLKNEREYIKQGERRGKRELFMFWLAYLILVSPDAEVIAIDICQEISEKAIKVARAKRGPFHYDYDMEQAA